MKRQITILVLALILSSTGLFAQGIINLISKDSLNRYVKDLSGDKTFHLNSLPYIIKTRNTAYPSSDINTAAAYIKNKFEYFGLTAYEQPFTFNSNSTTINAKNIIAVQTGSDYPNQKYIICAHYDSQPYTGGIAPGADDNASGTAAVIEAARVISQLHPKYTIVYALWSGEEQGLLGSEYYVAQAETNHEDIIGVINLDMIAWDNTGNQIVEVEYKNIDGKQALMNKLHNMVSSVNQAYGLNMTLSKFSEDSGGSDHHSFLEKNFPALMLIEDWNHHNTNYHQISDVFANLNTAYFEKCTKLALCTLAELAKAGTTIVVGVDKNNSIPVDYTLNQNYPNPFNPSTVISYRLADAGYVKLVVFDAIGREVKTLVDEYQSAGDHNAHFTVSGNALTSGVYFYKLQAGSRFLTKKMVYLK